MRGRWSHAVLASVVNLAGYVVLSATDAQSVLGLPSSYQLMFQGATPVGTETVYGGLLDGSARGPVGKTAETDPYFAEKVCEISIRP